MSFKQPSTQAYENGTCYLQKKTPGTDFAIEHLKKWTRYANGEMLVSPPVYARRVKAAKELGV